MPIFGLFTEETLGLEGAVDLLSEAARRRFMLRRLLIELMHFFVELVNVLVIDNKASLLW